MGLTESPASFTCRVITGLRVSWVARARITSGLEGGENHEEHEGHEEVLVAGVSRVATPEAASAWNLDSAIVRAPRASSQVLRQGGEPISAQAYLRYVEHEIGEANAA